MSNFPEDMALALAPLICDCWILLARDWTIRLHHTYHKARRMADRLAKWEGSKAINWKYMHNVHLNNLVQKCTPRECYMNPFVN